MGLFDFINKIDKKIDLTELKDYLNEKTKYIDYDLSFLKDELDDYELGKSNFFITDKDEYILFMKTIIDALDTYDEEEITNLFENARNIYNTILPFKKNTDNYEEAFSSFLAIFYSNGVYSKGLFSPLLYTSFENKKDFFEILNLVDNTTGTSYKDLKFIEEFVSRASSLVASERLLKSNIIEFIRNLPTTANKEELVERKVSDLEHYAGIYHIDRFTLAKIDEKINGANSIFTKLDKLTISIDDELKLLQDKVTSGRDTLETARKDELFNLKKEIEQYRVNLSLEYSRLLKEAKRDLSKNADELLTDFDAKIAGYKDILDELKQTSESSIKKVIEDLQKEGKLKFETEFGDISKFMDSLSDTEGLKKIITLINENPNLIDNISSREVIVKESNIVNKPNIIIPDKTGIIYALDKTIPYKKRYEYVMNEKAEREKNGIVYHSKVDDIIALLLSEVDVTPYLYGPSQCGKSYSVMQVFDLIGLPVRNIGKIIEEYNILGYNTATGDYSRTNFRDAYECGYGAFVDEIDSGDQNATLILNEFLGTGNNSSYAFPDGVIPKHPNFRCIAAGNTDGSGSNNAYSSRHKLDESILQRFTPVYYGYDETIEKNALKGYDEWLEFAYKFRETLNNISNLGKDTSVGNITTKDLYVIANWLKNKQFGKQTAEKIIEYQFIENKKEKELASICEALSEYYSTSRPSSDIYNAFVKRSDEIRKRGRK